MKALDFFIRLYYYAHSDGRGGAEKRRIATPNALAKMTIEHLSTGPGVSTLLERSVTRIPLYKVLLHNDDINTTEHVVTALARVFNFDLTVCERIMIEAHTNRVALCAVEPLELAELHRDQLSSFSLVATIEPE